MDEPIRIEDFGIHPSLRRDAPSCPLRGRGDMGIAMARQTVPRAAEGETRPQNAVPKPLGAAKIAKLPPVAV